MGKTRRIRYLGRGEEDRQAEMIVVVAFYMIGEEIITSFCREQSIMSIMEGGSVRDLFLRPDSSTVSRM